MNLSKEQGAELASSIEVLKSLFDGRGARIETEKRPAVDCKGHNFEVTGSCFARTDFHCDFFKLELLASAKLCLLDDSKEQAEVDAGQVSERDNLIRLQKLLAVRAINDLCQPVTDL